MDELALGLDLGTTGVRVVAVDAAGKLIAEVTHDYPLLTPRPGWTEQDPAAWKTATLQAIRDLNESLPPNKVVVLGLSGQMHGMVPLDSAGNVIRPAILWNDQRLSLIHI